MLMRPQLAPAPTHLAGADPSLFVLARQNSAENIEDYLSKMTMVGFQRPGKKRGLCIGHTRPADVPTCPAAAATPKKARMTVSDHKAAKH